MSLSGPKTVLIRCPLLDGYQDQSRHQVPFLKSELSIVENGRLPRWLKGRLGSMGPPAAQISGRAAPGPDFKNPLKPPPRGV